MKTSSPFTFTLLLAFIAAPRAFALDLSGDSLETQSPDPDPDISAPKPYTPPPEVAMYWEDLEEDGSTEPMMHAEARLATTLYDDFQLGARLGGQSPRWKVPLGFFLDFEGRPFARAVRVRESDVLEYQFREHRFTVSPGASLNLPLENGRGWWTFAAGAGLSFGTYRGSARMAEFAVPLWFETGYRVLISPRQYLGFTYQYFPLPDVSPHRIAMQWGYRWRAPSTALTPDAP